MSVRQRENEGEKAKENERDFGDLGSHIAVVFTVLDFDCGETIRTL